MKPSHDQNFPDLDVGAIVIFAKPDRRPYNHERFRKKGETCKIIDRRWQKSGKWLYVVEFQDWVQFKCGAYVLEKAE